MELKGESLFTESKIALSRLNVGFREAAGRKVPKYSVEKN